MITLLRDLAETYVRPGEVLVRKRGRGLQERHLLAYLILACILSLLARFSTLIDLSAKGENPPPPEAFFAAMFVAAVLFAPLFFYGLAGLSHLLARAIGGKGTWQSARLALFWALFALQPLVILTTILKSYPQVVAFDGWISGGSALFFLWVWLRGLQVMEKS